MRYGSKQASQNQNRKFIDHVKQVSVNGPNRKKSHQNNKEKSTENEDVGKSSFVFNIEHEISKIKIHVPLTLLMFEKYLDSTIIGLPCIKYNKEPILMYLKGTQIYS